MCCMRTSAGDTPHSRGLWFATFHINPHVERMDLENVTAAEDQTSYYLDKTWVQCESPACLKWRLIPRGDCEGFDPDRPWYCHMDQDPSYGQCSVPQGPLPKPSQLQQFGLKFIYSKLPVGSLVMVKAGRWPWWPAVLSPDPVCAEYVQEDSDGDVVKYHVEFLGSPHSRLWASAGRVQHYQAADAEPKHVTVSLKKSYGVALEEAAKMENVTCEERLQLCLYKPHELLDQAESLMHDIEKKIEQCTSVCTSTQSIRKGRRRSHTAGDREWIGEDSVVEVGNMLIINGIVFRSGRSSEEIMKDATGPVVEQSK
ncbi:hypothetical protein ANANG_G00012380 [Anguilla anguilla]|uniref:CW-type domain-containing protein n=1 Tax=Anguilla anguilla TaxID=7936 RepID=A0A9D3S603_ANGAN|nr:hypothetical protein ANANG_G00012380 [Anguilla anguilla]